MQFMLLVDCESVRNSSRLCPGKCHRCCSVLAAMNVQSRAASGTLTSNQVLSNYGDTLLLSATWWILPLCCPKLAVSDSRLVCTSTSWLAIVTSLTCRSSWRRSQAKTESLACCNVIAYSSSCHTHITNEHIAGIIRAPVCHQSMTVVVKMRFGRCYGTHADLQQLQSQSKVVQNLMRTGCA